MSTGGVFYLDEDRDKESSTSPRHSPSPQHSVSPPPSQPTTSTLQVPPPAPPPPSLTPAFGRKSGVFGATPSFPSPLAQAITVPSQWDSSSSSSHSSPHPSDDDDNEDGVDDGTGFSPLKRPESKSKSTTSNSESTSPSSSRRSLSRPPSPPAQTRSALTPGGLLMSRVKRSGSSSVLSGAQSASSSAKSSPPRSASAAASASVSAQKQDSSPTRSRQGSVSGGSSGLGTLSETGNAGGSSPLAFGSPELEPANELLAAPRPISVVSPSPSRDHEGNILGLGWAGTWDAPAPSARDKGKGKEVFRSPSPKRELASPIPVAGAPRQRRASEFLRPSSIDLRKLPPPSPTTRGVYTGAGLPTLSSSASMISPLNPLPSPWSEVPSGQSSLNFEQPSPGGAAIRLNRVPTSVRLAADLIKMASSQTPPLQPGDTPTTSTASISTPNTSPADLDRAIGAASMRKQALGNFTSLPPGALSASTSPTAQRWINADVADTGSLSPLSSPSASSAAGYVAGISPSLSASPDMLGESISGARQRIRASVQDALTSPLPLPATPPPAHTVSPVSVEVDDSSSTGTSLRLDPGSGQTNSTPGSLGFPGRPVESRLRSVANRGGLAMDLAGMSSAMGDAASHATMIMQSRQAKVERWKPRTSLGSAPPLLTPTEASAPSRLSASYIDQPGHHWGLSDWRSAAAAEPSSSSYGALGESADSASAPHRPGHAFPEYQPPSAPFGSVTMEKQASATGAIAGIEWVDWYDCYKSYKAEKIRAETIAANDREGPSIASSSATSPVVDRDTAKHEMMLAPTVGGESASLVHVSSYDDSLSAPSHQSGGGGMSFRRRSLSIRSTMSAIDHKMSASPRRSTLLERPRQSSGGSIKSSAGDSQLTSVKRKKNLVNKMEGWWTAVKSNFTPEPPSIHQRYNASVLYPQARVPSAPQSRRGSDKSGTGTLLLSPPEGERRASSSGRSVRPATSHMELRPSLTVGTESISSNTEPPTMVSSVASMPPPPPPVAKMEDPRQLRRASGGRSGLEVRRNQPSLRLDLEPSVLRPPSSRATGSSGGTGSTGGAGGDDTSPLGFHVALKAGGSRSSSYGISSSGLTPGVSKWDQTPSPLLSTGAAAGKDDKPVAPGADVTVASVRHHIKQRLTAAKEQCDATLKRIGVTIQVMEEERMMVADVEDPRRDYFDTFVDSPVLDPVDSEDDQSIPPLGGFSSRGPSRRGSMSLTASNVMSSPSRRVALLANAPGSPRRSMSRRRPSIVPRVLARDIQQNSRLHLEHAQSTPSSRSTSRSRSPMPHSRSLVATQPAMEEALEADRKFLASLQELIIISTDVVDTSVDTLIARPTLCAEFIRKLQKTGEYWDDHEDWPGRDWYVDILMAVATLNRVLDWWQAEKGFWNFDDDADEPLAFVLRPARETPHFDLEPSDVAVSPMLLPARDHPAATTNLTLPPGDPRQGNQLVAKASDQRADETVQAIDELKILAEQAKSINIVMELSLQGQEILYVNDAIFEVIGQEPEEVLEEPITDLLAPADTSCFAEATENLLQDDDMTAQLRFRFEVHDIDDTPEGQQPGPVYIELEGVGMLIRDNAGPSHTMWVMKPVTAIQVDNITDAVFPREGNFSTECVLCRICEREIVVWFFEKHNETCDAVHRLEAEIAEIDEVLGDLQQLVVKIVAEIGAATQDASQHQEVVFYTLPDSITTNSLTPTDAQGIEVRKADLEQLQEVSTVLAISKQIEAPCVQEDEADLPFNIQRYISPQSEDKLSLITRWQKPATADGALGLLVTQVENQLRLKQKAVARMQSTIRYSEKTRHEWEDKVNQMLAESDDGTASESGSDGVETTSSTEPAVGQEHVSPGHRKIAPLARLPITQGHPHRHEVGRPAGPSSSVPLSTPPIVTGTAASTEPATWSSPTPVPPRDDTTPAPAKDELPREQPAPAPAPTTPQPLSAKPSLSPLARTSDRAGKGHSRRVSSAIRDVPMSPRIPPSALPGSRAQPSIKDFQIIKPISRGAFGSVYLAKKVATGDYYAIKALKKSDMIAKNQITNVKAERTILMNQATSPYVVRLFFSFQSKEYLYLVMEYLNGGDCSTLVKTLGELPIDWARNYIGELVLGLEYLHARNVAHRDIKPDNLLIDSRGHLKLTDFGLSKIGLLNRQIGGPRPPYFKQTSLRSAVGPRRGSSVSSSDSAMMSPDLLPVPQTSNLSHSYFPHVSESGSADESSGSESGLVPRHLRQLSTATKNSSDAGASNSGTEPPRVVGTPDYLAPESILGGGTDDRMVDWWAVGVVLYEFLYGFPPFHAETAEKVFDNIVSRRINWHDDEIDVPPEAHDLMDRLMCANPGHRLGARGADEVKQHAFFAGINWATLTSTPAIFVPDGTDPESTDYFDPRGANNAFHDDEKLKSAGAMAHPSPGLTAPSTDDHTPSDDFGAFTFKNLPVLKQANDDVIRKMRSDSMAASWASSSDSARDRPRRHQRHRSGSRLNAPPSPSTSTSSAASTPSRTTPLSSGAQGRRPSDLNALSRVKSTDDDGRRTGFSGRFRASSSSSSNDPTSSMDASKHTPLRDASGDIHIVPPAEAHQPSHRSLDVLIAEDNPISQKILETLLSRLGCRCVSVRDGPEALAVTGNLKFDVIFLDMHMPFVTGEQVARMIRSTNNPNQNCPIIAATAYDDAITEEGTLFSAVLPKPVSKADLIKCLSKVGFVLSTSTSAMATEPSPVPA